MTEDQATQLLAMTEAIGRLLGQATFGLAVVAILLLVNIAAVLASGARQ